MTARDVVGVAGQQEIAIRCVYKVNRGGRSEDLARNVGEQAGHF